MSQTQTMTTELDVSIPEGRNSGTLKIASPTISDNAFNFLTCEGVLSGNKDLGLFLIQLAPSQWRRDGRRLGYTWTYAAGARVDFDCVVEGDSLAMTYRVTNESPAELPRVQIHPCLPTSAAPAFRPPRDEGVESESGIYTKLYRQLFLWKGDRRFAFAEAEKAKTVHQLAFMKEGEAPVEWAWWRNDSMTFDLPFVALESLDRKHVIAYGFEEGIWSSSNIGDARACFHLFPYFGDLLPGQSREVKGRLYLCEGNADSVRDRFLADMKKVVE